MATWTFLGVPIDSVGRSGGTEHGPAKLRELGLVGVCGADAGDLDLRIRGEERDPITGIVGSPDVLTTTAAIREATAASLSSGERPFLVGGCCAELPGALAGARDVLGRVGVAYLDGHLDLYARELAAGPGRYWLHLDVDILGEDVFPATDYLMPDGLDMGELVLQPR